MQNTLISYLYRDASNYKVHNEAVVAGIIDEAGQKRILASLSEGEFFLPECVGLPEKKFDDYSPQDDHPWFELNEYGFEPTDAAPTVKITADELVAKFEELAEHWDEHIDYSGFADY